MESYGEPPMMFI